MLVVECTDLRLFISRIVIAVIAGAVWAVALPLLMCSDGSGVVGTGSGCLESSAGWDRLR